MYGFWGWGKKDVKYAKYLYTLLQELKKKERRGKNKRSVIIF